MANTYHVKAIWDSEAQVYYSRTDIPGLNIEAATLPEFIAIAEDLAPQMLEANVTGAASGGSVKWKVSAELDFAAAWLAARFLSRTDPHAARGRLPFRTPRQGQPRNLAQPDHRPHVHGSQGEDQHMANGVLKDAGLKKTF